MLPGYTISRTPAAAGGRTAGRRLFFASLSPPSPVFRHPLPPSERSTARWRRLDSNQHPSGHEPNGITVSLLRPRGRAGHSGRQKKGAGGHKKKGKRKKEGEGGGSRSAPGRGRLRAAREPRAEGIEPSTPTLEVGVLPLNYAPARLPAAPLRPPAPFSRPFLFLPAAPFPPGHEGHDPSTFGSTSRRSTS